MLEKDIEKFLKAQCEKKGIECLKFLSGVRGVPDRVLVCPGGKTIWVELKRPSGGVVAPLQKYWQKRFSDLGHRALIIRTKEEVENLMREFEKDGI